MAARSRLARPACWLYLAATALLSSGYALAHLLGPAWLRSGLVFNLLGGASVAALIFAAHRDSGRSRLPLYLFAIGQALFVTSDVLADNYGRLFGSALPFPSIADPFHLAFYPFLVAGMLLLIRERNEHRDRAALIDALIVTVALATLLWVYLIAPYADDQSLSLLTRLTSIAYPAMDIIVLGVVARVAAGSHRREPAFVFLLVATVVLLLSDALYGWRLLGEVSGTGVLIDTGWATFYALLGTAALHPSMRQLSEPGPEADAHLTRARLALLACASLTAPLLILVREALHESLDIYVLVGASVLMFALVLLRMAGIVRRNEEATAREAALRLAGEALVSASTREEIGDAALTAARAVIRSQGMISLYLGEGPTLAAAPGSEGELASLTLAQLPETVRAGRAQDRVELERCGQACFLAPLLARGRLAGVLAVQSEAPLRRGAQESVVRLAREVAVALRMAVLAEEAVHERSEARLSSLIKNSSDVICILGEDTLVHYVSPSVEQTFGYPPETIAGDQLTAIVHPEELQRLRLLVASIAAQPGAPPASAEFRIHHARGSWRTVEAFATNLLADDAIAGVVLNIRDISERKAFQAELEHQSFHDALTGLPNRALFHNRVAHALAAQRREELPVAVLLLDIDDFKNVNDSLGHGAGDEVLQEVARRLEDCMRPVDTAARLGGDEFAVLIHQAESEEAIEIAHRIVEMLEQSVRLDSRQLAIATSIGIAFSTPDQLAGRDADELLRNADAAMYIAKENGKGHYQVFQPEMHAKALARLELKSDLQRGFDAGEFTLRYQPIIDLARGDMAGMEALVRWEHPARGTVQALDFIPLLESTGLIVPVGRHILREACSWAAHMQGECPRTPPLSIAVNVSACQLQRPELIEEVRSALAESAIPANSLTLELTESVMMQDMELSLLRLKALRALGVKLAIDDFGTGYSSLNYIRQLPVDILKIDRSFLADPNPEVAELTATIVQLARIFKLQAVAEGIETPTQLERLLGMSCDFGQGFHFAEPLSGEEILAMARGQATLAPRSEDAAASRRTRLRSLG